MLIIGDLNAEMSNPKSHSHTDPILTNKQKRLLKAKTIDTEPKP